jgi:hypothetical protein
MLPTFKLDRTEILVVAALLEGCGYYVCKDDLKRDFVPQAGSSRWQDAKTLDLHFGAALRPPEEVDPRRFALLRYNAEIASGGGYYCYFDVCYREFNEVAGIPESLSWDPAEPGTLRLHFAEPIPASSCEPWPGDRADFQALELIYLGVSSASHGDTGDFLAEPDQLAYFDDQPIEALGPDSALLWLEGCFAGQTCELDSFCTNRGRYGDWPIRDLWVDCP